MFSNYFKIALRNLQKNKAFSAINILGLALGMACSLIIMLWVQDEVAMDSFHENGPRLYRVMENQFYSGKIETYASTPGILAENIVKDIPEIEKASQMLWEEEPLFTVGNNFDKEKGRYVQGDFLNMFSFKLDKGDARTALKRPDGVVISKKLADKYFPNQDALGKTIRIDSKDDMMVTGILAEIPKNSSLKFDFLMSYDRWHKTNGWAKEWGNNGPRCYVMLVKGASLEKVNAKIKKYIKTKNKDSNVELFLQSYQESYLYSNWDSGRQNGGRIDYVRIFAIVAIIILAIACINFMNLATARSVKRAKEVGVRKVIGAMKSVLIGQFIGEAILITFMSLVIALLIVFLLLPTFNMLTEKELSLNFTEGSFWLFLVVLTLLTGFVAGSYPALFMSSLNPVVVLKGALKFKPSATYFRKGLVVFQFALSIILIVGMIIVHRQINFLQTKNIGFDRENLLYMPLEGDLQKNFASFKQALQNQPGIKLVTSSQANPLEVGSSTQGVSWPGKDTTQLLLFANNSISYDYIQTMGIQLIEGRDFGPQFGTDTTNYIINEATARKMGYKDPVGKEMTMWGRKGTIVGLMKDFHHNTLHVPIEPLILRLQPKDDYWGVVVIRTEAGKIPTAIASTEKIFKQFNPHFPFKYFFADQELAKQYKSENVVSNLSNYFAFLAIFISCLGLFGLAAFTAEQRTKEIGVRKVLGASVGNLVQMLSLDFLKLVLIATLIAFPIAWYFLKDWLQKYAYRIDLEWWYFLIAAVSALVIALVTVSFQAIKAALMNPVKSLKSE
ncbi:ABC transporter permease [Runella zeae]|uniref:ABC transporter permease n=1 Tax=Runella zeae TaxID=94255 RepID=UPI0003FA48C0|nr:ABC transporter permease [Runella zeae]